MARGFNLARTPSGTPNTQSIVATAAQVFKKGALLIDSAAGTVSECGADPAAILGVAMMDAFSGLGYDMANSPAVVTGRSGECVVAICDRSAIFSCRAINGATDPVTPLQTHVGESYGVAKVGTDWVLDIAEVTVKSFKIVDIDIDNKIFFVKLNEAFLSLP